MISKCIKIFDKCQKYLYQVIGEALEAYLKQDRREWVKIWAGQAVLAVTQKYWTSYIQEAFQKGGDHLAKYLELNNSQISDIVEMVRGKLSKQNRVTLQALIVLDVHARDVLAKMVEAKIDNDLDFQWLSQMRYYWEVSSSVR